MGPGLGESVARRFHAEGCSVALLARSADTIVPLADELGDRALAVPADISDRAAVTAAFEEVREVFEPVDILVNHASAASRNGLLDCGSEEFQQALAESY